MKFLKYCALVSLMISLAAMGLRIRDGFVSAPVFSTPAALPVSDVRLGPAAAAPLLTRATALRIAERSLSTGLFAHTYSAAYGSFNDPGLHVGNGGTSTVHSLGSRDVWRFTISGLHMSRPCPAQNGAQCPPIATLVVYVDDKSGTMIEMDGY